MTKRDYWAGLGIALLGVSGGVKRYACTTCSVTPWNGIQDSRPPTPTAAERLAMRINAGRFEKRPQLDSHGNIIIPEGHVPFYRGGHPSLDSLISGEALT